MTTTFSISNAASLLKEGECVAFPTETVYGLGANAYDDHAVAKIFALKGRPQFNPLIIHVANIAAAKKEVVWNNLAEKLAAAFWPGPLTMVLPRRVESRVSLLASAGLDTLAIRIPAHPIAQQLLASLDVPIAAPSANRSGRVSPTLPAHVKEELGENFPVLGSGACTVGVESTVLSLTQPTPIILRHGGITREMIEALIGPVHTATTNTAITAPGMLESHYAPSIPVRLNATHANAGEALLGFGDAPHATLNLSPTGNLNEAAANLFAYLRKLDSPKYTAITVMPIPTHGLGAAIHDRLQRASI